MTIQGIGLKPMVERYVYVETYGCQMNVGDSEILVAIMREAGWEYTEDISAADVILVNTCSVRDNAEQRIWGRLAEFRRWKRARPGLVVGIVGCMAERLREQLIERAPIVDIVAGPDSYRDMPRLVAEAQRGGQGINVELSREETYAEIRPVRLDRGGVSAFVSIMRGCNNFCTYCIVPYTRGRERSRDAATILREVRELWDAGYREVTLLGQNVNSYNGQWSMVNGQCVEQDNYLLTYSPPALRATTAGSLMIRPPFHFGLNSQFPQLIASVAEAVPGMRVRFATSHPKDLSDELLAVMAAHPNICRAIHLPAQSGSTRVLGLMNRRYTREWYVGRIEAIRRVMPDCAVSTDLLCGFCGETEADHAETLSLMREVGFDAAFMFKYSEREGTRASEEMADDVPEETKSRRLAEIIELQNELSMASNRRDVGRTFEVLVEGASKKGGGQICGRTSQNKMVVFEGTARAGERVNVVVTDCSSATLFAEIRN